MKSNRLIVVLGMHRSGTSVITRALQVLGVNLGDSFLPLNSDNVKGFWEDADINAFNIEMLSAIESDWHYLAPIEPSDVESLCEKGYFHRAIELLRQKVSNAPIFGFKDPRLAKLLPFWKRVFSHCQYNVCYILAMRHPLSVAKSLAKRNGFDTEKSYLLWLGHVITSLSGSAGNKRVLVDYDRLMQSPDRELIRIEKCTGLKINPAELQRYKTEFLDWELRHTAYDLDDLLLDDVCPPIVREVYADLLDVASDKTMFDDTALQNKIVHWSDKLELLKSLLLLADKLFTQREAVIRAMGEREGQIASLNQAVAERDGQIDSLNQAVTERVGQIASLNQAVAERDGQIASLNQAVAERDGQIVSLNRAVAERDGQIVSLNRAVAERDGQIVSLNRAVAERDGQIDNLNQNIAERDGQIDNLNQNIAEREHHIRAILESRSWRLTGPLRNAGVLTRYSFSRIHRLTRALIDHSRKLKVLPLAIARWGVVDLSKRVYRVFRVSGVRGVLRRIESFRSLLVHEGLSKEIHQNRPRQAQAFSRTDRSTEHSKPKVAYVVNQHDLMTQVYRVLNYAEALAAHGYSCEFLPDHEVGPGTDIDADILVLNRIAWCKNIDALIRRFRESGRPVIFDVDDFVFDPDQIYLLRATAQYGEADRELIRSFMQRTEKAMRACDFVTVSTFALKKEVEKRGLPAFVLPNNNGLAQAQLAKNISAKKAPDGGPVRIGYFSGTKTHEEDFMQCAGSLVRVLRENPNAELLIVGQLDLPSVLAEMESRIQYRPLMPHQEMLVELSKVDVNLAPLELGNIFTDCKSELKLFEAALFGIPTVASPTSTFAAIIENGKTGYLAATPDEWYAALTDLVSDHDLRHRIGEAAREIIATRYAITTTVEEAKAIYDAAISGRLRRRPACSLASVVDAGPPLITIVSVLYRKAREVRYFLEALRRQDFPGRYEVLLVDDRSPDDSVAVVQDFQKWVAYSADSNARMDIRILRNQANIGNCGSRNVAIREARADVVIVVDADCMFNQSFLSAHFAAHMKGDCDVAIGPINIETGDAPPLSVLGRHEATSVLAENESLPQDPTNLDSFVNCITRNFSIRRSFIEKSLKESLFDEAFSYSADPQSGFGWEDVEMGYRVYRAGGRIKYLSETVSIHVTHESSANEFEKPLRSLRNFRRLFEKHPEILLASRQWSIQTYEAIVGWGRSVGADLTGNPDYQWLDARFRRFRQAPVIINRKRKLNILTHRWHVPHQFELYKTGHDFTLLTHTGTALCDQWEHQKRPMPSNARMISADQVDPREFDLAILHFDENALRPDLCNGKVPDDWGRTLRWFIDNVDLPKVAICHGTPQFVGQYNDDYKGVDLGQILEAERNAIVNLLGDIMVVCNSYQAQFEWGFKKSRTIWHGFSPHEYPPGSHDRGILVMLEDALRNRPHYNGLFVYKNVLNLVGNQLKLEHLKVPDPPSGYLHGSPEWAVAKYQNYTREVGRYSVYFNPTVRSPMPRARGEAMMAGLVSVSLRNHDVDLFIKNGVNGFYADTPEELAEQLIWLTERPAARMKLGQASRTTAMDVFNQDRYLSSWSELLNEISL